MLIRLQRNLKMISVNVTKVEKINKMVYGEIKAVYDSPKYWKQGQL